MREIKFRAWDEDEKCFIYFQVGALLPIGKELERYTKLSTRGVRWYQSTGLLDKNGKEIWEGDIVVEKVFTNRPEPEKVLGKVIWKIDRYMLSTMNALFVGDKKIADIDVHLEGDIEVIGNRFENPELLTN